MSWEKQLQFEEDYYCYTWCEEPTVYCWVCKTRQPALSEEDDWKTVSECSQHAWPPRVWVNTGPECPIVARLRVTRPASSPATCDSPRVDRLLKMSNSMESPLNQRILEIRKQLFKPKTCKFEKRGYLAVSNNY